MPRRLSNIEWATFLKDIDGALIGLPPWGGIVHWNGIDVLVFIGANGEVNTTDVTDLGPAWESQVNQTSQPTEAEVFLYSLPENVVQVMAEDAKAAGQVLITTVQIVGQAIGAGLGAATKPLFENLGPVLIVVGLVLAYAYVKNR